MNEQQSKLITTTLLVVGIGGLALAAGLAALVLLGGILQGEDAVLIVVGPLVLLFHPAVGLFPTIIGVGALWLRAFILRGRART
jgi:hypothetical protein